MVAIYGANSEVHDHITRNPGSFQATMNGISLLNDTGARFTIQLIPMKENYHQFQDMVHQAKSMSQELRIGASWLYLSAKGSYQKNLQICAQRLSPNEVITLEMPDLSFEERLHHRRPPPPLLYQAPAPECGECLHAPPHDRQQS